MMTKFLLFFLIIGLTQSCATNDLTYSNPQNVEEYYQSKGLTTYILADLPDWANFVSGVSCYRNKSTKFIDVARLKKSFNLSNQDAVYFQFLFNKNITDSLRQYKVEVLTLKEEEIVFFKTLDQVVAKFYRSYLPKFNKISVIWVDSYLGDKSVVTSLKRVFANTKVSQGEPVLMSLCQSFDDLEKLAVKIGHPQSKIVSSEFFSIFDEENQQRPGFMFNVSNLGQDKAVTVFAKNSGIEKYFIGSYKTQLIQGDLQ